jgi:ergothioneine biosynthesis protein EgtB
VQAGERHCRARRGYLSRPTVEEVWAYREAVDVDMEALLGGALDPGVQELVELGLNHEQQHQELMLTDLKHVFSVNPLRPAYLELAKHASNILPHGTGGSVDPLRWISFEEGIRNIGRGEEGFSFDNEGPIHRRFLEPFALGHRLVTNGEYLEFMADGGYRRPELWMYEGWGAVERDGWRQPFYWEERDGSWWIFTLSGMRPLDLQEPVCHVNWYEADAFARWAGARLPLEEEWEVAAAEVARSEGFAGNFVESGRFHPAPAEEGAPAYPEHQDPQSIRQLFGDVWEWTASPYTPYPGFRPAPGAVGEYNGKFMVNQFVLRGGSCATPRSHIRTSYRNFFHPDASWQFTGIRLARDSGPGPSP